MTKTRYTLQETREGLQNYIIHLQEIQSAIRILINAKELLPAFMKFIWNVWESIAPLPVSDDAEGRWFLTHVLQPSAYGYELITHLEKVSLKPLQKADKEVEGALHFLVALQDRLNNLNQEGATK